MDKIAAPGMVKAAGVVIGMAALAALLLAARPAAAGGWVAITLDELPGPVRAGEEVRVGFMVRQHGVTPINNVEPVLRATNRETGETMTAEAQQVGATGHFEATVVFPEAGEWAWQIGVPPFPQQVEFAPLTVAPATAGHALLPAASGPRATMRWAGAGLLLVAAALALIGRRRETVSPEAAPETARSPV